MFAHSKRLTAGLSAAAIALGICTALPAQAVEKDLILFESEAEKCTVTEGAEVADKVYNDEYPGFTGDGFVWSKGSGGFSFDVELEKGAMYEICVRCYSYLGDRLQTLAIDGEVVTKVTINQSKEWDDISFGFHYIPAGKHTITVGAAESWGYILYDTVTFGYAKMPEMNIKPILADKNATAPTQSLMNFMTANYGKQIMSGQQEIYGSGHDGNYEYEFDYIEEVTGKLPVVRGFDLMNYNPLYGWDDESTERIIDWTTNRGGIATVCWHLNVPIDFENYTLGDEVDWQKCTYKNYQASNGTFNTAKILEKDSKEREYFDAAVDLLAEQLLRVQDAGSAVIFRPLHEAQGNYGRYGDGTAWFWWGDRGPEVYKELWKLLFTELTEKHGVHNLIWELNLYEMDNSMEWYPGDEYVDMVAYDKYEGSPYRWETNPATSVFLTLVGDTNDTKMVALAECDKIPDITKMQNEGAWWSYICPWYDDYLTSESNNTKALLKEFYNSDAVLTLDEMPADLYTAAGTTTKPTGTTATTTNTTTTATTTTGNGEKLDLGNVNCDEELNVSDAVLLARLIVGDKEIKVTDAGKKNADVNQDEKINDQDLVLLLKYLAGFKVTFGK